MPAPHESLTERTLVVARHPLGKGWLLIDITGSPWTTVSEHKLKREATSARDAALTPAPTVPPSLADVARYIAEQTPFTEGFGNAGLLVSMVVSDLKRGRTTTGEFGKVQTSEGAAFDALLHYLNGDLTGVYRVLAMLAAADPELACALATTAAA